MTGRRKDRPPPPKVPQRPRLYVLCPFCGGEAYFSLWESARSQGQHFRCVSWCHVAIMFTPNELGPRVFRALVNLAADPVAGPAFREALAQFAPATIEIPPKAA